MADPTPAGVGVGSELGRILRNRSVRSVYQPIVDLESRQVVAYEALARGPAGSPLESPGPLFEAARAAGHLFELDWHARFAAIEGAQDAGLPPWLRLFVNIEPDSMTRATDPVRLDRAMRATRELSLVAEFTERALTRRPVEVMDAVEWLRALGLGVAIDDVGADVGSLALMPVICPDVIKLDMRLIQSRLDRDVVAVANAVQAEAELQRSTILAEGVETEAQLARALSMGARLGQGWMFGRPGPLPTNFSTVNNVVALLQRPPRAVDVTPFSLIQRSLPVRRHGDAPLLAAVSRQLEDQARDIAGVPVVLACFQHGRHFSGRTRTQYEQLASWAPLVAVFGVDMPGDLPDTLTSCDLDRTEPLASEWSVAVIGPHFAGAMVAQEDPAGSHRTFRFALTYQRELVLEISRILLRRLPRPQEAEG